MNPFRYCFDSLSHPLRMMMNFYYTKNLSLLNRKNCHPVLMLRIHQLSWLGPTNFSFLMNDRIIMNEKTKDFDFNHKIQRTFIPSIFCDVIYLNWIDAHYPYNTLLLESLIVEMLNFCFLFLEFQCSSYLYLCLILHHIVLSVFYFDL